MSDDLIKALNEKRLNAVEQMREIAERDAKGEARAEDAEAFERASHDVDNYKVKIDALVKERGESRDLDNAINAIFDKAAPKPGEGEKQTAEYRDWVTEVRESLAKGERRVGSVTEIAEARDILAGTATHGKETVPSDTLANSLFRKLFLDGTLLSAGVQLIHTNNGNKLTFPRLTSRGSELDAGGGGLTVVRRSEAGTIHKNAGPTFDTVELDAYGYGEIQQISHEATEDPQFDLRALMGEIIGQNMANYLDSDFTNGSGTNEPRGLLTVVAASGNVLQNGTAGEYVPGSFDEILDLMYKLDVRYRARAKFAMQDATVLPLRKIKVTAAGDNNYAWQPSLTAGGPDTLVGRPVVIDPFMPAAGAAKTSIVFADFSKLYVRLVNSVRVEYSTEYAWDTDMISVKAVVRADCDSIDDSAFAGYEGAAT